MRIEYNAVYARGEDIRLCASRGAGERRRALPLLPKYNRRRRGDD